VKRAQGSKNKKKKKADEAADEVPDEAEDIDPNEPRYCICDDVSYGEMISCDNHVSSSVSTITQQWFLTDTVRERVVSFGMRGHDLQRYPFSTLEMVLSRLPHTTRYRRVWQSCRPSATTGPSWKPVGRPVIPQLLVCTES
jgi:hypothetical protein